MQVQTPLAHQLQDDAHTQRIDSLRRAQALIDKHDFIAARTLLNELSSDRFDAEVGYLRAQLLMEQGALLEADMILAPLCKKGVIKVPSLRMRVLLLRDYLQIYLSSSIVPVVKRCRTALRSLTEGTVKNIPDTLEREWLLGMHSDYLARALLIQSTWEHTKSDSLSESITLFTTSAHHYALSGRKIKEISCYLRVVDLLCSADRFEEAELHLHQADGVARHYADPLLQNKVVQGKFLMRLKQLRPKELQHGVDYLRTRIEYVKIEQFYDSQQVLVPFADLLYNVGQLVFTLGGDPTSLLDQAQSIYLSYEHLSGISEVQALYLAHYSRCGDSNRSLITCKEGLALAERMGFHLGIASRALSLIDSFVRAGAQGEALAVLQQHARAPRVNQLPATLLLGFANAYHMLGVYPEAQRLVELALRRAKTQKTRAQGYFIATTIFASLKDLPAALRALLRGRRINVVLGDLVASAESLQLEVQLALQQSSHVESRKALHVAKLRCLRMLRTIDKTTATPPYHAHGVLQQTLGQIALQEGNTVDAIAHLGKARESFLHAGARRLCAHTDVLLGLVYQALAREQGRSELFQESTWHFTTAQEAFKGEGLQAMVTVIDGYLKKFPHSQEVESTKLVC
jgi:tetratricopeptide (TPR) repeat protein